ncbi:MAG: DUF6285 domain-containing protein [Gammaproteobacteria bacterium]|nr:DUF6285 domain-containing protein [Gammaproteobacteria bacterium]
MPTDRPTASELLEAIREFLSEKVAPNVEGQLAFHVQVAGNVLAIVERTLQHGSTMDAEELQRLQELLTSDGNLMDLNHELAEKIRNGDLDEQREQVFEHLLKTVKDKLHLANPRYLNKKA